MTTITTTVSPCIRYVLVRNVQCKKHLKQQEGDMEGVPGESSVLTEKGNQMAQSLGSLIEYLDKKPYCISDGTEPEKEYMIVIDNRASQHTESSKYLRENNPMVPVMYTEDIVRLVKNKTSDFAKIEVYIIFTDITSIRQICKASISKYICLGSGLGATTIFDILPNGEIFVHEFSNHAALEYGGFDTSQLFWWNNSS